mmetsp:Transcript_28464/g.47821  ORF Transcript_28464/g.47821 Transcript_28464/m.47821 type:complete len:333 (+) Transcript_28464:359-1357(+)
MPDGGLVLSVAVNIESDDELPTNGFYVLERYSNDTQRRRLLFEVLAPAADNTTQDPITVSRATVVDSEGLYLYALSSVGVYAFNLTTFESGSPQGQESNIFVQGPVAMMEDPRVDGKILFSDGAAFIVYSLDFARGETNETSSPYDDGNPVDMELSRDGSLVFFLSDTDLVVVDRQGTIIQNLTLPFDGPVALQANDPASLIVMTASASASTTFFYLVDFPNGNFAQYPSFHLIRSDPGDRIVSSLKAHPTDGCFYFPSVPYSTTSSDSLPLMEVRRLCPCGVGTQRECEEQRSYVPAIIGGVIGGVVILSLVVVSLYVLGRKHRRRYTTQL